MIADPQREMAEEGPAALNGCHLIIHAGDGGANLPLGFASIAPAVAWDLSDSAPRSAAR